MDDIYISIVNSMQESAAVAFGWPKWVTNTIAVLCTCILILGIYQLDLHQLFNGSNSSNSSCSSVSNSNNNKAEVTWKFRKFQLSYLIVYLLIMLADWLQGTNMYTLYSSYGMNVGFLFLTGFLTSAIFGGVVGGYVDKWGRRFGCVVFCVLEIIINTMEHVPSLPVLFIGRILGGISTNLLFSAFEAWMVSEHRKLGFSESSLVSTFTIASWGNGITAIVAGFIAQWSVTGLGLGDIGPFQLAIALTVLCLVLILMWWGENYGGADHVQQAPGQPVAAVSKIDNSSEPASASAAATGTATGTRAKATKRGRSVTPNKRGGGRGSSSGSEHAVRTSSRRRSSSKGREEQQEVEEQDGTENDRSVAASPSRRRSTTPRGSASPRRTRSSTSKKNSNSSNSNKVGASTANSDRDSVTTSTRGVVVEPAVAAKVAAVEGNIFALLYHQPQILLLGFSQACFEGAVYSFVFMWVPVMMGIYPSYIAAAEDSNTISPAASVLPTGLVFSCFMLSMTLGGMLFSVLLTAMISSKCTGTGTDADKAAMSDVEVETRCLNLLCVGIYTVSSVAMAVPVFYSTDFTVLLVCFLTLEAMVGMFNAGSGTLRSMYYIEAHQSSIISAFRIPLNLLVVCGTVLTSSSHVQQEVVFVVLAAVHCVAAVLQIALCMQSTTPGSRTGGGAGGLKAKAE